MNKKAIKTIAMVVFATLAGYGGVKAYDYSYGGSENSKDNLLMQNIEALSDGENIPQLPCNRHDTKDCYYTVTYANGDTATAMTPKAVRAK